MSRIRKVDSNQASLVKQIRKIPGVSVAHTHVIGDGFPDVVIGFRGKNFLAEIKDPAKFKSQRKLTGDEEKFHVGWKGQVETIETLEDVLNMIFKKDLEALEGIKIGI